MNIIASSYSIFFDLLSHSYFTTTLTHITFEYVIFSERKTVQSTTQISFNMSTDTDFRRTLAFNPSTGTGPHPPKELAELVSTHPNLKIYTPSSPHFQGLKAIWNLEDPPKEPLSMIRVTNSSEVCTMVKFCVFNNLPLGPIRRSRPVGTLPHRQRRDSRHSRNKSNRPVRR